jgi:hypothetical protein
VCHSLFVTSRNSNLNSGALETAELKKWSALVGPDHHSAKKATTQPKKFEFDHEIIQNGIICMNLVEKM